MNAPSARSSRASAPRRTTKRAPESRAAASKSISPSALADVEVLARREGKVAPFRPRRPARRHVVAQWGLIGRVRMLVGADRHVRERGVRDRGKLHVECLRRRPLLGLGLGERVLQRRDLGLQRLGPRGRPWPPSRGRPPSRARSAAPAGPAPQGSPPGAPSSRRDQPRGQRLRAPVDEADVECSGIVADGLDVVHEVGAGS